MLVHKIMPSDLNTYLVSPSHNIMMLLVPGDQGTPDVGGYVSGERDPGVLGPER